MAANLATLPGYADFAVRQTKEGLVLSDGHYAFLKSIEAVIADLQARSELVVKSGAPAVGDVPDGQFRIIKNTTGPTYSLVVNDGGTLKSVALT